MRVQNGYIANEIQIGLVEHLFLESPHQDVIVPKPHPLSEEGTEWRYSLSVSAKFL